MKTKLLLDIECEVYLELYRLERNGSPCAIARCGEDEFFAQLYGKKFYGPDSETLIRSIVYYHAYSVTSDMKKKLIYRIIKQTKKSWQHLTQVFTLQQKTKVLKQ